MHPSLVTKIRMGRNIVGMATNAVTKRIKPEVTVKGLVHAWYNSTQVASIFGLSHLSQKDRIKYDLDKADVFLVHIKPGTTKFISNP